LRQQICRFVQEIDVSSLKDGGIAACLQSEIGTGLFEVRDAPGSRVLSLQFDFTGGRPAA